MWKIRYFKKEESANKFMNDNRHKYQSVLIFVHNGYAVEYKPLIRIG